MSNNFFTSDYNKFMCEKAHTKLRQANLEKNSDLNAVPQHARKILKKYKNYKRLIRVIFLAIFFC